VVDSSRPVASVARELGLVEQTLRNWVKAYRESHVDDEPPLSVSERARLRELEKENRGTAVGAGVSGKAAAFSPRSIGEREVRAIDAEKATRSEIGEKKYTIRQMCAWLGVSPSGTTSGSLPRSRPPCPAGRGWGW